MKNLIVASTSTIHGGTYLSYLFPEIAQLFSETEEVLFIPYARPSGISHNKYTEIAQEAFSKIGKKVIGIHSLENPVEAVNNAKGIFIGGGNTFVLVSQLYKKNILEVLREAIFNGLPYLGTSAGSNICGVDIKNTNDMPIVYPPSFKTLGCFSFNINAHYLDPEKGSKHMGESRETRIKEFHVFNETPVLGLREGSWLSIENNKIILQGEHTARLFLQNQNPVELQTGIEVII